MTLQAKQKMHLGENSTFGPIHDAMISLQCGRYGIEAQIDSLSGDGSKSWVVISRGLDTHVSEMSVGCKQSMYIETATQQDARSGAERSVADMTFATRSKVKAAPTRRSEPSSPPVKQATARHISRSEILFNIRELSVFLRTWREQIPCMSRQYHQS